MAAVWQSVTDAGSIPKILNMLMTFDDQFVELGRKMREFQIQ